MSNELYKEIELNCEKCKAEFEIWVSFSGFDSQQEKMVRKNIYYHCPPCETLARVNGKK